MKTTYFQTYGKPKINISGGCDGCLNAGGFLDPTPNENDHDQFYTHTPINATNNKGLDKIAERLELIYTTIDWPFIEASQEVSLFQSGKSRADLWQLAGLVALEQTLERANRACDLDFHARQQVELLLRDINHHSLIYKSCRSHCLKVGKNVKLS